MCFFTYVSIKPINFLSPLFEEIGEIQTGPLPEPAAMLIHRWSPETKLITHTAYIKDYGEAKPFRPDPDYPGKD